MTDGHGERYERRSTRIKRKVCSAPMIPSVRGGRDYERSSSLAFDYLRFLDQIRLIEIPSYKCCHTMMTLKKMNTVIKSDLTLMLYVLLYQYRVMPLYITRLV